VNIYLALFAAVAIVGAVAGVVIWARRTGRDLQKGEDAQANVRAAGRVADAQAGAPVDITDLLQRLRDGKRKL
jgi:hypothetical protein